MVAVAGEEAIEKVKAWDEVEPADPSPFASKKEEDTKGPLGGGPGPGVGALVIF